MSTDAIEQRVARIRERNDRLRQTGDGGSWMLTAGVRALPAPTQAAIFKAVQSFAAFNSDNDPYREHDFGRVEVEGAAAFWKIDSYGRDVEPEAELSDPAGWTLVLTVMLTEEY